MKTFIGSALAAVLLIVLPIKPAQGFTFEACEGVDAHGLQVQASPVSWNALFGFDWPLSNGMLRVVRLDNGFGLSFPIDTSNVPAGGEITAGTAVGESDGALSMSLSTCAGDLSRQNLLNEGQRCLVAGPLPLSLRWQIGGPAMADRCVLQAGRTYYLNFAFITQPYSTPALTSCSGPAHCGFMLGSQLDP